MRFQELDDKMRVYETLNDRVVPPGNYMVARLDGKGFTKLAERLGLNRPFDEGFHEMKNETCYSLMDNSGFDIKYIYHQSDEISILFDRDTQIFNRKHRKYNSVLSSFTSLAFQSSLVRGSEGEVPFTVFDCRLIELPSASLVVDYFSWRQADSSRNCLSTYCYWILRQDGFTGPNAAKELLNKTQEEKHALVYERRQLKFQDIPKWQSNGTCFYKTEVDHLGYNPITKEEVLTKRNRTVSKDCDYGDTYREWFRQKFLTEN